jgi:DNA-binding MarR family transcriptional regulator
VPPSDEAVVAAEPDSLEWVRQRWEERGGPAPAQFVALLSTLRASDFMGERVDEVLRTHGLTRTAYFLLITLQMTDGGTRPLGQLSKRLLVHPTTGSMVVDQLVKAGLVTRRAHPTDRRTVLVGLRPAGRERASAATHELARAGFGLSDLGDEGADRVAEDLRLVRRGPRGPALTISLRVAAAMWPCPGRRRSTS